VTGLRGQVVAPFTGARSHRFRVRAKVVVLAAGCMATPVLLQKSGDLANGSGQVGRNLQFHPGGMVTGVYPDPVRPQFGATQGYQSLHFLEQGFKLETFWAPVAAQALRFPGFGHDLKRRLAEMPRAATWDAIASCHRSLGTVRARGGDSLEPKLHWRFDPEDVRVMGRALWELARIHFAAGADKILPGVHGLPDELHSLEEARVLQTREWKPTDITSGSTHVFCTTRMHGDPTQGVVDPLGRCHDVENLYIADTGIFPRCTSVNPMLTGMALAHRTADAIRDRL
jgi:choline dehydrogenase-like flavoprotein